MVDTLEKMPDLKLVEIKTDLSTTNERVLETAPVEQPRSWIGQASIGDVVKFENGALVMTNPQTGKNQIRIGLLN